MKNTFNKFLNDGRRLLFSLFIIQFLFITKVSVSQWIQCDGIYGGSVSCLVTQGSNIYAGTTFAGVYITTNNGNSWSQTALNNMEANSLGSIGNNVLAGTGSNGVWLSTNNGANWTQTELTSAYVWEFITVGSNIFAGTGSGVYKSTNNGINWSPSGLSGFEVFSFTVNGSNLFASTYENSSVYISTDNGASWSQTSLNNQQVYSLTSLGTNIYAGTSSNGIYRSTDNGTSWSQTSLNNLRVDGLIASGGNIIAGTGGGVYVSSNGGSNWTFTLNVGRCKFTSSSSNIFAGGELGGGISMTTNNGLNWSPTAFSNAGVGDIVTCGNNVFASDGSLYKSTDDGINWLPSGGLENKNINRITASGSILIASILNNGGVYISTNSGSNWVPAGMVGYDVRPVAVSGTNIFAGVFPQSGLWKSTDFGANWTQISSVNGQINSLASNGSNIFVQRYSAAGHGVFRSTDFGETWIQTPLNQNIKAFAINGNNIYAGSDNNVNGTGVYHSTNNGDTWVNIGLNNQRVWSLAAYGNYVYAGALKYGSSIGGVSVYDGVSWTPINQGLIGPTTIYSLCIKNNFLLSAPMQSSVWRRPLSQITANQNNGTELPSVLSLSQNYPNPFNPTTKIRFAIPSNVKGETSNIKLTVFDALGREIEILVNESLKPGIYEADWNAKNLTSGVYFYRLITDGFAETKKMLLIK